MEEKLQVFFLQSKNWENIFTPKGALRIASPSLQTKIAFVKGKWEIDAIFVVHGFPNCTVDERNPKQPPAISMKPLWKNERFSI